MGSSCTDKQESTTYSPCHAMCSASGERKHEDSASHSESNISFLLPYAEQRGAQERLRHGGYDTNDIETNAKEVQAADALASF